MRRGWQIVIGVLVGVEPVSAQATARASVSSGGFEAHDSSLDPVLSADGRLVAFTSYADDLIPSDQNGVRDVFVHDRVTGATTLASVTSLGAQAHGPSELPHLSRDGRFVAFESSAADLVANDANGSFDVFVRDLVAGTTECASRNALGATSDGRSGWAALSGDGRFVAFSSDATDLVAGNPPFSIQVFVRDRLTNAIELASRDGSGTIGDGNCIDRPVLSADGRYVAFASWAANLVANDTNATSDVFVRDRLLGTTERVSLASSGAEADSSTRWPAITPDGRFVAFMGPAANLWNGDLNVRDDVFVRDRLLGTTVCASVTGFNKPGNHWSRWPSLSDDGRFIAFLTNTSDILPGDVPGTVDLALRDFQTLSTTKLDFVWNGAPTPPAAGIGVLSGDARVAAFYSGDPGYVLDDTNQVQDVFTLERLAPASAAYATYCTAKTSSQGCAPLIGASGIASASSVDSLHVTATNAPATKNGLLVWSVAPNGAGFGGGTLCVKAPLKRTAVQNSGGTSACDGSFTFAFERVYWTAKGVGAGQTLYAQWWARDPGFAPPNDVSLSAGVSFSILP